MRGQNEVFNFDTIRCATTKPDNMGRVGFAITIITSPTGEPLVFNVSPDDYNDFTITKATIAEHTKCPFDRNPEWARFSIGSTTKVDVNCALCSSEDRTKPGPYGRMIGFPVALDSIGVATASIDFNDLSDPTGFFEGGLRSIVRQEASDPANEIQGYVQIRRRL